MDLNDEDLRRGYDSGTCSRLINEGLAEITGRVMELAGREQVAGLLLTGGGYHGERVPQASCFLHRSH